MATFEDIAGGLERVLGKADDANAAMAQAGRLADEATGLLAEVMRGSHQLEDEFTLVVQAWSAVANGAAELSDTIAAGCKGIESYRQTLRGGAPRASRTDVG